MSCNRYMNQINKTLNDINNIKQVILKKEKDFMEYLNTIDKEFIKINQKLNFYDLAHGNFSFIAKLV